MATAFDTSDSDRELSAHSRRLRLRNSLVRPSRLSYGSSGVLSPPRRFSIDDDGWQTEDPEAPPELSPSPALENALLATPSAKKRRSRNSAGSALSCASTLLNTPEAHDSESIFPLERAMTSPTPGNRDKPFGGHRRNRSGSEGAQGSARYVDYLEHQVADLLVQVQAYTSPASNNSHAAKLRKLSNETRNLRAEINDWEAKFNIRVQDEVTVRAAQDITLRGKIAALEERLEAAQDRCRYVEEELDYARERLRDMKGLEEENRALEFRIEALSGLLADSARMHQTSAPPTGRPTSMVLTKRRASSLNGKPTSRRASLGGSSPGGISDYGISDPIEHVLSTVATLCGPETTPRTIHVAPPTPISPLPDSSFGHSLRSRRMRRFPPGSLAPKTLILPSAAIVSPTLPTIRTFFGAAVADPGSMCTSTRPSSAGSNASSAVRASAGSSISLYAELARAEDDASDVSALPSPALSDSFALVTEAISNPTPLLRRAIEGLASPSGTLVSARKKAMAVLAGGIDRVARRRGKLFHTAVVAGRRRKDDLGLGRARCECGCLQHSAAAVGNSGSGGGVFSSAAVARRTVTRPVEDDAVENVWLWVRFVVAIVVALGVAVREGPAVVLGDGEEFDSVGEEEREVAIRALGTGGRVYGVGAVTVPGVEERVRRTGDERLRMWERERARSGSGGGVHVGEGRRKGMEWGV